MIALLKQPTSFAKAQIGGMVPSYQDDPVVSSNNSGGTGADVAILGESNVFEGIQGVSNAEYHGGVVGIQGNQGDRAGPGVYGQSRSVGVWGQGDTWHGVYGHSDSTTGGQGVFGEGGTGVAGVGHTWIGVYGETKGSAGGPAGVWGDGGEGGVGVKGHSRGAGIPGVGAYSLTGQGPGLYAEGNPAGLFRGDINVSGNIDVGGDIRLLNADCAEEFELELELDAIEPGTVVVLSEGGRLQPSERDYDKRVAGVVSGAGDYRPGLTLDARATGRERVPVALMGKVFCRADARRGAIGVGDMLTTSATPGHAMKATDPLLSFGSVIGKALAPLGAGRGLIPVLATLR